MLHSDKHFVCALCPENFPETDFESHGLINLTEEISRKNNIQIVTWLLLSTFRPIYWEEGREKYFFFNGNCDLEWNMNLFKVVSRAG